MCNHFTDNEKIKSLRICSKSVTSGRPSGIVKFPGYGYGVVNTWMLHLSCTTEKFGKQVLHLSSEDPVVPSTYKLKLNPIQIQTLWLIAEVSVLPYEDGCIAGWRIKDRFRIAGLEIEDYTLSRSIIKPLERIKYICHKKRNTTNPGSRPSKKDEKAYYLNPAKMREVFDILRQVYLGCYFDGWVVGDFNLAEANSGDFIKSMRFHTLTHLQEKIGWYENSAEFYIDHGIKPSVAQRIIGNGDSPKA